MDSNLILLKLIEQSSETLSVKIDGLSDTVENLNKEMKSSKEDHKEHEKIAYESRLLLENHLKSDAIYQESLDKTLASINETLKINTESLVTHIKRTDLLEELYKDNNKRIVALEEPVKFRKTLKKHAITIFSAISALFALAYYIAGIVK